MFLSDTHLPQILPPQCYFADEFYEQEQQTLFQPSWQCLATLDELPKDGSFVTKELYGTPLLVWMKDGAPHVFVNACAHRFAQLSSKPCGFAERLTCQYHGWQYDCEGNTQRIPDAQSFRPLENGQLGLAKLESQVVGKLVFASLRTNAGDRLDEQLGGAKQVIEELISTDHEQIYSMTEAVPANWKVIIENAIESYHVGCVHANSFAAMPAAETCTHGLTEEFTSFETNSPSQAPAVLRAGERMIHSLMGVPHVECYRQYHVYPNVMVSTSKFISVLMLVEPQSPRESRFELKIFGKPGPRRNPLARTSYWIACQWAIKEVVKVLKEDFGVLPAIQKGIEAPQLPGGGLISIREERIFHFQKMIANAMSLDSVNVRGTVASSGD